MHLFYIPQCNIQNRNVHISVLNVALWDMEQVHSGICEIVLLQHTDHKFGVYLSDHAECEGIEGTRSVEGDEPFVLDLL